MCNRYSSTKRETSFSLRSAGEWFVIFASVSALLLCACAARTPSPATKLSYTEFDQTPGSGWRALAEKKLFPKAARLIETYLSERADLDRFQRANLHWHAAQVWAFAADTNAALRHLTSARLNPEPVTSPVRWNDYVLATEAFLKRDRVRLLAARQTIAKNPEDGNLRVVDSLIKHFDDSYAAAYQAAK
jgi:hypothetical protein